MYQALYRKYRPTTLDEVTGQEIVIRTLKNAIMNNKISHAYLFTGPRGTGKTSIAKILAKTVNCLELKGYEPCDLCVNCTQIDKKQSTDIIEIDAASNNGVDEIREIRNKVNLVPSNGKYKVYIIDEVHMLTTGAFNALLKTLEEPPSHIIFILATTEPHKIPATILSRCQRFDFKRIPTNKIVERLKIIIEKEKIKIEEEAIMEIARLSDGGMRDSISLLDQCIAYSPENITCNAVHEINGSLPIEELSTFINLLIDKDIARLLQMIDKFNDSGKNLIKISEEILYYLKNSLLNVISPDYLKEITNNYDIYNDLSNKISKEDIISLIDKFNISINDIKKSNDPKLSMELMIIKECSVITERKNISQNILHDEKTKEKNIEKELGNKEKQNQKNEVNEKTEEVIKDKEDIEIEDEKKLSPLLEKLKDIRINNTLAKFDKSILISLKKELYRIEDYLLDENYSSLASMIIDGELKAASKENLIYVFKTNNSSFDFNNNIIEIQELFNKIFNKYYKVISTDNISWEIIKKDFNGKIKKFEYVEEPIELEKEIENSNISKEIQELDNIFGNIVEYN